MFHKHLQGVLDPSRCAELIESGKDRGFDKAAVNFYGTDKVLENVRNNERLEFADSALAVELEQALQVALADDFPYLLNERAFARAGDHFRMYRYSPGQYFKPHRDGSFKMKELESQVTVLFYLNDADGGDTVLMPYGLSQTWAFKNFAPRAGDVLLFEHKYWHEGRPVNSGEKLVLRTDLFYRPS